MVQLVFGTLFMLFFIVFGIVAVIRGKMTIVGRREVRDKKWARILGVVVFVGGLLTPGYLGFILITYLVAVPVGLLTADKAEVVTTV
ncbi:MAG: hypothetical protein HYX94_13050 [Chloroflexi bacterium]|nr:hypothetical protein [Chloroflexota bacterium]